MRRLLTVGLYLCLISEPALAASQEPAGIRRGTEEQQSALSMLEELGRAVNVSDDGTLRADIKNLEAKILANQLDSSDLLGLMQRVLKLKSFNEIIGSLNNQHIKCIATATQNNLLSFEQGYRGSNPYALNAKYLEDAAMRLKNTTDFTTSDFVQLLAMSQLCEGLPFRSIREPAELAGRIKMNTFALAQILRPLDASADEMQLFAEFLAVRDAWADTKLQLNAQAQAQRLMDLKAVLRSMRDILAAGTSAFVTAENIKESLALADLSQTATTSGDYQGGTELYEAAVRRLFPLELSKNKQTEDLRLLIHAYNTQLQIATRLPASEQVQLLQSKMDIALAPQSKLAAIQDYQVTLQTIIEGNEDFATAIDGIAVFATPDYAIRKFSNFLRAADGALGALQEQFNKNQSYIQSWQKSYNRNVSASIGKLQARYQTIANQVKGDGSLAEMQLLSEQQYYLQVVMGYFFEAVGQRNSSVMEYEQTIEGLLDVIPKGQLTDDYRQGQISRLRRLMNEDTRENILWKAYLTRNNVTIGALSVLVVVEGLSMQLEAMPTTLVAISAAAKTVMITTSALNLLDRNQRDGWRGLMNIESAMDALTIMCLLPRGIPHTATAATKAGQVWQNVQNSWALLSRNAAQIAVYANLGMGAYQVAMADQIAQRMREQGINITPAQVRQQGLKSLAFSVLFFTLNRIQDTQGKKLYGDAYQEQVDKLKFRNTTTGQAFRSLDPRLQGWVPRGLRNYGAAISESWNSGITGKVGAVWKAVAIPAYHYILANEAFFFSYTTPDFVFENHVKSQRPLPDLQENETAVLLIGLDEADLLYAGAKSRDFLRDLTSKYGERFYIYDYNSPQDFFHIMKKHSEEHGRIRYLKVVTHGLPGLLATKAAETSPLLAEDGRFDHFGERGFISRDFLRNNQNWIRPQAESFMARDAQVVLISCLVGSNYDDFEATYGDKQIGANDVGDQFLDEFSAALLPYGGRVDASTRALIGLNMVYSSLFVHASMGRQYEELNRQMGILPMARFKMSDDGIYDRDVDYSNEDQWTQPEVSLQNFVIPLPSQTVLSDGENPVMYSAKRFAKMIVNFPRVAYAYGVALAGPAWGERYAFRTVEVKDK